MKKILTGSLLAIGVALSAQSASAADYAIGDLAQKYMTYTSNAQINLHQTSQYNGVGTVFIQTVSTLAQSPNSGYICTGSLLNATTVLTAAHCVYPFTSSGTSDPVARIRFYLPSLGSATEVYSATGYAYNSGYDTADHTGDIGSGHDVALFTLGTAATGHDTYSIYTGDPLQQYTEVGTGTIGGPSGTNSSLSDYQKRTGTNQYELYGDDLFSDVTHGVVLADFDDGTAAHDVFGRNLGMSNTGFGNDEASSSPGDSGGPEFINGQIVSVTSFGITGGIFQGYCGGNSTDPYNSSRSTTKTTDLSKCTNSSVGEIMGNTLTAYNQDFINGYLAGKVAVTTPVPESATWAMLILGFGFVGYSLRRRAAKVVFA
ncbi:PEPxxWA-CTERM sorting domain-containing protein [Sphingomonas sp.]|uniref:PEPxxWA-CTERM sorting domain-containing protein n=1 Tax=Sphingomonas sp. TaxID=28214 RepID=UPI0025FBFCBB|nr:PEPxxWA-CTERM sorting domain-containing protein [Sphingomonas sp.]